MAKSRARKLADIIVGAGIDIDGNLTFDGGSTSADLTFADNDKANFGDASDLQIYHDGTNSYIKDAGAGELIIQARDAVTIEDGTSGENYIYMQRDNKVALYYDGASKFETTSTGVTVTGQLTASTNLIASTATYSPIVYGGSSNLQLKSNTAEMFAQFVNNGAAELYYDNSAKLATTSTGIDVTGTVTMDGFASAGGFITIGSDGAGDDFRFYGDTSGRYMEWVSSSDALLLRDNSKILLGNGSDLQIYHDGSNSYIKDTGTGNLFVRASDNFYVQNAAGTETKAAFTTDGAVKLYYNGGTKFQTVSNGVAITGTANASTYAATGDSDTYFNFPAANQLSLVGGGAEIVRAYQLAGAYGILRVNGSGSATYPNFTFNGDDNTGMYRAGADNLAFATGGSERVRIDSSGRVGIGESNPSDTLEISGGNIVNPNSTGSEITSATFGIGQNIHLEERQVNGAYSDRTDLAIVTNTGFGLGESEKIRIEAGGNVGIGTTSPDARLVVSEGGTTAAHADTDLLVRHSQAAGATAQVQILAGNTANSNLYFSDTDAYAVGGFQYNHSSNYLAVRTNNSEAMRIDSSGRVLIGQNSNTGSANADNLVVGTGSGNNGITILSGTTNGGTIAFADADADEDGFIAYNHPSQFMQFGTAAAEQMRITSAGRVGINESSPDALLHITGQSTAGLIVENGAGNASTQPYVSMAANNYSSGYGTFRWEDQRASQASPSFIWEVHDGSGSVLAYDFRTGATGASGSKLAITQDGSAFFNSGSTALMASFNSNHSNGGYLRWMKSSAAEFFIGTSGTVGGGTSDYYDIYAISGLGQRFWTGALERMRITPGGNVGIGTTSPDALLEVEKPGSDVSSDPKLRITAQTYPSIEFYSRDSNSSNRNWKISSVYNSYGTLEFLRSSAANGVPNVTTLAMNNAGNVGIGTASPSAPLEIAGATNATDTGITIKNGSATRVRLFHNDNAGASFLTSYDVGAGQILHIRSGNNLTLSGGGGTEHMRITTSGSVGIGTTVPNRSDFNIHGANRTLASTTSQVAITASDSIAADIGGSLHFGARYDTTTTDFAPTGYVAGRRENATVNNYAGYLQFGVTQGNAGTIEAMRITSTGNVGIGTTSPGAKLEISGKDDAGSSDLLRLQFDNSPSDTGITFTDIFNTVKNRITMDASNTNDLRISAGTKIHLYGGTTNGTTSPHLTVSNNGNVGIGTTNPTSALVIQGAGSGGSKKNTIAFGTSGWGSPTAPNAALDGGVKLALFEGGTQKVQIGMDANARLWLMSAGSGAQGVDIYTGASNTAAPTLRFRVDQGGTTNIYGNLSLSSNLGIGTSSPSEDLHIYRTSGNADAKLQAATAGSDSRLFISRNGSSSRAYVNYSDVASGANWYTGLLRNTTNIFAIGQGDDFGTNTRLCIDNGGNVGIGTTNPSSKLEVNNPSGAGNGSAQEIARFVNTSSGATSMYLYLGASSGVDWRIGKNVTGVSGNANFSIANHSGTRMLDLTGDGHLALGITDPSNPKHRKVEVTPTVAVTSTAWSTGTGNNGGYDVKNDDSSTYSNYGGVTVAGVYNKHVAEWELHGNMSANTWYPVATMSQLMAWQDQTGSSQNNGFSMYFRIYAYDVGAGGPTYLSSAMTERIWVNGYTSNSTQEHRIHVGPWMGHAPNHSPTLYSTSQHYQLRIHHHLSTETYYAAQPVLEILVTSARTGLDGTGSKVLNIYGYVG